MNHFLSKFNLPIYSSLYSATEQTRKRLQHLPIVGRSQAKRKIDFRATPLSARNLLCQGKAPELLENLRHLRLFQTCLWTSHPWRTIDVRTFFIDFVIYFRHSHHGISVLDSRALPGKTLLPIIPVPKIFCPISDRLNCTSTSRFALI